MFLWIPVCSPFLMSRVGSVCVLVAQKIVATRKKQQLSIGPCKSLPNSPSHSSVCATQVSAVQISQVRGQTHTRPVALVDLVLILKFDDTTWCVTVGLNLELVCHRPSVLHRFLIKEPLFSVSEQLYIPPEGCVYPLAASTKQLLQITVKCPFLRRHMLHWWERH